MTSRKIRTYQTKAKNLCTISFLCLTWTVNANSLRQNIIVIKEICSWLPPFCKQNLLLFIQPRWQLRRTYFFNRIASYRPKLAVAEGKPRSTLCYRRVSVRPSDTSRYRIKMTGRIELVFGIPSTTHQCCNSSTSICCGFVVQLVPILSCSSRQYFN